MEVVVLGVLFTGALVAANWGVAKPESVRADVEAPFADAQHYREVLEEAHLNHPNLTVWPEALWTTFRFSPNSNASVEEIAYTRKTTL